MGLFNLFQFSKEDQKLCKLRDLITLAYIDGEFSVSERLFIASMLTREGIDIDKFAQVMANPEAIKNAYPKTEKEKLDYLDYLVSLMMVDNECTKKEIQFCEIIAKKLGFDDKMVSRIVWCIAHKAHDEDTIDAALSYISNGGKKLTGE